ncbi:AAA family ATPase [Dactylosporangium sp. CS-047395]|uniref:ATP-binding protein n=1 Tax=Dactylosporangium sp. CS-047395 TaxID=3239936 RepID=UPI003D8BC170
MALLVASIEGVSRMQLEEFAVHGLFGRYNHVIPLPTSEEDSDAASVVILHGPNGVGKTTVLQMLSGMMSLNFDPFRRVPFTSSLLRFNSGVELRVDRMRDGSLRVQFKDFEAYLNGSRKGALKERDQGSVEELRTSFFEYTSDLSFEFLPDTRLSQRGNVAEALADLSTGAVQGSPEFQHELLNRVLISTKILESTSRTQQPKTSLLAERIKSFAREAQVDYRQFFGTTEPDLFPKIIDNLSNPIGSLHQPEDLEKKIFRIHELERTHLRLGLGHDRWDFEQLLSSIESLKVPEPNNHALVVLNTYVEYLESRADARQLIAERLLTFEEVMRDFFTDKRVRISRRSGIEVESSQGERLTEAQLSSGEYQLLYLMISALTTRRRGTVIAIDEPELSMHPAWTRRLVRNILRCASRATPQLILATHSPEIAVDYAERLVRLSDADAS